MTDTKGGIVIIGAGIQGCCTALELARLGHSVTLLDRDRLAMNRASLRNEGKIHLGLVYAADTTMATAELQLRGALTFWPRLQRLLGGKASQLGLSTPFDYVVAHDSLLSKEELHTHYKKLQTLYEQQIGQHKDFNYLGARPQRLFEPLDDQSLRLRYPMARITAAFATAELAISTETLAGKLRQAIAQHPLVDFQGHWNVDGIRANGAGIELQGQHQGEAHSCRATQVVNAAWDGRLALDEQMGIQNSGWVHRLKYRVIVELPAAMRNAASATMVLGRYGDVVVRPDNTAYLSWYPDLMRGWSHEVSPPDEWQFPSSGDISPQLFEELADKTIRAISDWLPAIAGARPITVDAGAIVAFGQSDVDDPDSGLHQRLKVGVTSIGGYHSLDAGKLTTAPMFAEQAARRVAEQA